MVGMTTVLWWFGHLVGSGQGGGQAARLARVPRRPSTWTGELDRSYLTRLRARGGLKSYPSRTKDPGFDFSTVGASRAAPLFAAATRRYVELHGGPTTPTRFIASAGDAELDEGNVWEAITEPALQGLGT